ncbi:hypothetical protein C8Q72DRAFT_153811 [Fomitopsis betulina]|nr:hypothetical protein C8Q72DRAFT_153811 [Fomitopsis betulina]
MHRWHGCLSFLSTVAFMVRIALLWITWWWVALGLNAGRRWTPCDLQGKLALLGGGFPSSPSSVVWLVMLVAFPDAMMRGTSTPCS